MFLYGPQFKNGSCIFKQLGEKIKRNLDIINLSMIRLGYYLSRNRIKFMLKEGISLLKIEYFFRKLESITQWLRALGPNCPTSLSFYCMSNGNIRAPNLEGYSVNYIMYANCLAQFLTGLNKCQLLLLLLLLALLLLLLLSHERCKDPCSLPPGLPVVICILGFTTV